MEPHVRLYNPNTPGEPRKRAARAGNGSRGSAARNAATRTRLDPVTTPQVASPAGTDAEAEAQSDEQIATGPVVSVADFEDLFTRFQTPICNFVFRLVGNREQAYDLAQDVFVKAYRALAGGTTIQA